MTPTSFGATGTVFALISGGISFKARSFFGSVTESANQFNNQTRALYGLPDAANAPTADSAAFVFLITLGSPLLALIGVVLINSKPKVAAALMAVGGLGLLLTIGIGIITIPAACLLLAAAYQAGTQPPSSANT